ncbi:MAG: BON domain-containing protein, partial [Acidobacteriota bacterium]|nr:BON domain-containing protein [Acidobacteriota bacterium]
MKLLGNLAVVSMLSLTLAAAEPKIGKPGQGRAIKKQVAAELARSERFRGVEVKGEGGIVTLSGHVALYIDKLDAENKARRVESVDAVRNRVAVESRGVSDEELLDTLANKLRYDRVEHGLVFNTLAVQVEDGRVTVRGFVRDYPDRNSALAIVATTPGVRDVVDEIQVGPPSPSDDSLRIRLARAIYGHLGMEKYAADPHAPI